MWPATHGHWIQLLMIMYTHVLNKIMCSNKNGTHLHHTKIQYFGISLPTLRRDQCWSEGFGLRKKIPTGLPAHSKTLREPQHTQGVYPRHPQTHKWKEFQNIDCWLGVWGLFQRYVGKILDSQSHFFLVQPSNFSEKVPRYRKCARDRCHLFIFGASFRGSSPAKWKCKILHKHMHLKNHIAFWLK